MPSLRGFTLIELSIVLVIIGLIIGGVLVGKDLIKAASLRAQITQIESYNTAIYVFRNKYNGLPGDLESSMAARFGMTARSGAVGHGNGDDIFQACDGQAENTRYYAGCETLLFWTDLSHAELISERLNTATDADVTTADSNIPLYFPRAKIGNGSFVGVFHDNWGTGGSVGSHKDRNKFFVGGISLAEGAYELIPTITPMDAYSIDSKVDDGFATSGWVGGGRSLDYLGFNSGMNCRLSQAYNLTAAATVNTPQCQMYFEIK